MSWQASHWAKKSRGHKTITDKAVLMILAEYANPETWEAFPSQKALAEDLECSKRTIQRSLDSLQEGEYLTKIQEGNQHQHSIYRLNGESQLSPAQVRAGVSDNLSHATPVTGVCDTGDARTVREPSPPVTDSSEEESSSSGREEDDLDHFLRTVEDLYTDLPSGLRSPLTKPAAYFKSVRENGSTIPRFRPLEALQAAELIQHALEPLRLKFPHPKEVTGLDDVHDLLWGHPKMVAQRGGLRFLHLRACIGQFVGEDEDEEEGNKLNPDTVLTRLARQPDTLRQVIDLSNP